MKFSSPGRDLIHLFSLLFSENISVRSREIQRFLRRFLFFSSLEQARVLELKAEEKFIMMLHSAMLLTPLRLENAFFAVSN